MFDPCRHAANSEFETLGAASRAVLDGIILKRRAANAPENALKKDRMRANAPGLVREVAHDGRRFTLAGVNGKCARSRE